MHIRPINDNQASAYPLGSKQPDAQLVEKLGKLAALRGTLSALDPATNGPPSLNIEEESCQAANDRFPAGWLHELWVPSAKHHAVAMAWALAVCAPQDKPLLLVTSQALLREQGLPYGPGLLANGLAPEQLILARTKTHEDALWAIEEAVKSGAFSTVIAELSDMDLTSSRRLSLAVQHHEARCLLLMRSETAPQTVAYSRWRVEAAKSVPDAPDTAWPGPARLMAHLHKHRGGELPHDILLEWQHAHHRFHLVPSLVDEPVGPQPYGDPSVSPRRAAG